MDRVRSHLKDRSKWFVAGALTAGAMLFGAGPGASVAEARSFATGGSFGFAANPDAFYGQVNSDANQCRRGRLVKVFRELGRRDRLIGRARASSSGQWMISRSSVASGRYYLKIPRVTFGVGDRHVCRAYKSSTLRFGS